MEKILKILIGIVLAILLFFWLSSMFKGCSEQSDPLMSDTETTATDTYEEDEFDEDFFEDDSSVENIPVEQDQIDEVVEDQDVYAEPEAVTEEKPATPASKPVEKPKPVTKPATTVNSSGKYMVLAGSYMIEANAEKQVDKLKRQGYNEAQVVYFDDSKYHSVVAFRSNDYNEAQRISSALKRKGIDNYVHTQKE